MDDDLGFVDHIPGPKERYDFDPYTVTTEELRLKKILLSVNTTETRLHRIYNDKTDIDGYVRTVYQTYVWGMNNKDIYIDIPASWWQMFKKEFAPKWFIKKYPIVYIRHTINSKTLYPMLDIKTPELTHTIVYSELPSVSLVTKQD